MEKYARIAQSLQNKIFPIRRPFSFFDFIDDDFMGLASLRRILSQVRLLGGNTMIVEVLAPSADLAEENSDIKIRYPVFRQSSAFRLSFFKKNFSTQRGFATTSNNDFIGYAILKSDVIPAGGIKTRIYESVIQPSRHPNNCIHGCQKWSCRVIDKNFEIHSYLYAQQNNSTNVCAHVAIRTAAACYHKSGDMSYGEMNRIVGINHTSRKCGGTDGGGLTLQEVVTILEAAGARCFVGDYENSKRPPIPFQKYLYGSIESGFPAIVCFGTTRQGEYHAIPVFGHTFSEDTWVPNADISYFRVGKGTRYIPSESWMNMFIAHDDNWGSNYCIPRHYLHSRRICTRLGSDPELCPDENIGVASVIATVPKAVKVSPIRAEVIGVDYLFTILPQMPSNQHTWDKRLSFYAQNDMLVLRPILVSGKNYTTHLQKIRDWEGRAIAAPMVAALKDFLKEPYYWLIELSVPELFSANRRKIGEVLLRADIDTGNQRDFQNYIITRMPGYFALYEGGGPSSPRYKFLPSGTHGHVELYGSKGQK
jgi:hypothetical protein